VVEALFHLFAYVDLEALREGGSTLVFEAAASMVVLTSNQDYSFLVAPGAVPAASWLVLAGMVPLRAPASAVLAPEPSGAAAR
jgi:hypothetical protein